MRTFCLALIVILSVSGQQVGADEALDLLVRGGTIVDGTGNPWFVGDLGIRGDRIAHIGRRINEPAKREIDAANLIVAPGFIDIHSHSDTLLLEDGNAHSKITQGVTTEVLGEGNSAGPYQGKLGRKSMVVDGKKTVKSRIEGTDEWTHYLRGADNNAVARDTVVGPPRHMQWVCGPPYYRSHEITL